jgi:hypothetical protein
MPGGDETVCTGGVAATEMVSPSARHVVQDADGSWSGQKRAAALLAHRAARSVGRAGR